MHIHTIIPVAWVYVFQPCFAYLQIDLVLFVHLSMWHGSHCLSHKSHTQESVGSWNVSSLHRRWWKPCTLLNINYITYMGTEFRIKFHSLHSEISRGVQFWQGIRHDVALCVVTNFVGYGTRNFNTAFTRWSPIIPIPSQNK